MWRNPVGRQVLERIIGRIWNEDERNEDERHNEVQRERNEQGAVGQPGRRPRVRRRSNRRPPDRFVPG